MFFEFCPTYFRHNRHSLELPHSPPFLDTLSGFSYHLSMKKLFLGDVDEHLMPKVKEELLHINQRRLRILVGVIFSFQLLREVLSFLLTDGIFSYVGTSFSFVDIMELAVLLIFFLILTFFSKHKMLNYLVFHLFLALWIFSILFSLLRITPSASDYTVVLTIFINIMLINLFFYLNPLIATGINIVLLSALIIFEISGNSLSGFLLFSAISTVFLLAFVDVNLYRTTFFQVYYRIKNQKQLERIRDQNIELGAQNEEIRAQQVSLEGFAKRIEALITNIPGVVYRAVNDSQWTMVYISKRMEELSGYPSEEFQSRKRFYADIIVSEDRKPVAETINKHIEKEEPFVIEYRIITKTGETKWVREYGQGVPDKNNDIEWLDGAIFDINEEKRIARLREDVERTVRHDLKNPLSAIIGFSSLLQEEDTLDDEGREYLSLIKKSGFKMLHMINNSLDLFKMEEGNYQFTPAKCDLLSVMKKVILEQGENLPSRHLTILFTFNEKVVTDDMSLMINGEEYNLESLFANLLSNAVDASPPGETVTISIMEGDPVKIEMHNMGAIPEEIRENFFSRYTTSGKKQGTGIGTYSARLIAKAHGGNITFTTSEREGTTLYVTLPRNFSG